MLAEQTAIDDCRDNLVALNGIDAQLDVPVIQQQRVACGNHFRQVVGRRHASLPRQSRRRRRTWLTGKIADNDGQRVAWTQIDRPVILQLAGPNLRTAEVLHQRDAPSRPIGRGANALNGGPVRLVRTVRKIQTEDVGPGLDQLTNGFIAVARRTNGRNNLCMSQLKKVKPRRVAMDTKEKKLFWGTLYSK